MPSRGLDRDGFIVREGDAARVQQEFRPLVAAFVSAAHEAFDGAGLDSVYLYGSVPRGAARPGVSDLDGQVLLGHEPTSADRARARDVESRLAAEHPEVSGVGILLDSRERMTDPARRFDEGFHVRVLCAPVWGPDAGAHVSPHRPDLALARQVQGDWRVALARLRSRADSVAPADEAALCRAVGRRLTRVAFTWVMPRWGGWTSDPRTVLSVVGDLEPSWTEPLRRAIALGWDGRVDVGAARSLMTSFGETLTVRGAEIGAG
jgi:uncharacterized protein